MICNEYIFRCHPIGILVDTGSCHLGYFQNRKRCKSVSSVYCCSPQLSCNTGVQMDNNIYKSCNRRFHRYDLPLVCSRLVRSSYICNRRCTLSFPMASSWCGDQSMLVLWSIVHNPDNLSNHLQFDRESSGNYDIRCCKRVLLWCYTFVTACTEVDAFDERSHAGNHIIVVVMVVQIDLLLGCGSMVNDSVEISLDITCIWYPTRNRWNVFTSSIPHWCRGTPALVCNSNANSSWIRRLCRIEFHWSCPSILALAVTMALAQHMSSLFCIWMMQRLSFRNLSVST